MHALAGRANNGLDCAQISTPPLPSPMLKRLLPKQNNFFELFQQSANLLHCGAEQFVELTKNVHHADIYAKKIDAFESAADDCTLATFDLLHKTFITPFDRQDLHQLTRRLDDILDMINRNAQRIVIYQLASLPDEILQIAELTLSASNAIKAAIQHLGNLKNASAIVQRCHAISEIDHQSEQIMLKGIGRLFLEEQDFKHLLKIKEIYEHNTAVVQECHDLSDLIKDIVLEYS
jgi:uncharacterized protein Yka (UPF0111/DUF47 family)